MFTLLSLVGALTAVGSGAPAELMTEQAERPAETLTPLMQACGRGDLGEVRRIVQGMKASKGDDPGHSFYLDDVSSYGRSANDIAAAGGFVDIVSYLLDEGSEPFWWRHASPLQRAVIRGDEAGLVAELNKSGAQPNQRDTQLWKTPLCWAAEWGKPGLVQALLSHGANPDHPSVGPSPMLRAYLHGRRQAVQILLDHPFNPRLSSHLEALSVFASRGEQEFAKKYLAKGLNLRDAPAASQLLIQAAAGAHVGMVRLLLEAGAPCKDGRALAEAAQANSLDTVKLLLKAGASLESRVGIRPQGTPYNWHEGLTPLCFAARNGNLEMAKLLVEKGAEINPTWFDAPLDMAAGAGRLEVARYLVTKGAKLVSDAHMHAVQSAGRSGVAPLVDYLISVGASRDRALLGAVAGNHLRLIQKLLKSGALIDGEPEPEYTPLGMALYFGANDAALLLLEWGADPSRRDRSGRTALDLAANSGAVSPQVVDRINRKLGGGKDGN